MTENNDIIGIENPIGKDSNEPEQEVYFSVSGKSSPDITDEYVSVSVKLYDKSSVLTKIFGAALIVLCIIATALGYSNFDLFFSFGIILTFLPSKYITIRRSVKASKKAPVALPSIDFTADYFYTVTDNEKSVNSYDIINSIIESDNLFILKNNRNSAYVLDKSSFTLGDLNNFSEFIQNKTGKSINVVTPLKYTWRKKIIWAASLLLVFAAAFCSKQIYTNIQNAPQTFGYEEFSVILTKQFHEFESETGNAYGLITEDSSVIMWSWWYSKEKISHYDNISDEDFGKSIIEDYNDSPENIKFLHKDGKALYFEYTEITDGETFYFYTILTTSTDRIYITEFICSDSNKSKYKDKFEKWAESIKITPATIEN